MNPPRIAKKPELTVRQTPQPPAKPIPKPHVAKPGIQPVTRKER